MIIAVFFKSYPLTVQLLVLCPVGCDSVAAKYSSMKNRNTIKYMSAFLSFFSKSSMLNFVKWMKMTTFAVNRECFLHSL